MNDLYIMHGVYSHDLVLHVIADKVSHELSCFQREFMKSSGKGRFLTF